MADSLPPNPRQARRPAGRPATHLSLFPVTVFLITVSLMVAVVTRRGADMSRAQWMFMEGDPTPEQQEQRDGQWQKFVGTLTQNEVQELLEARQKGAGSTRFDVAFRKQYPLPLFIPIRKGEVWRLVTPIFLHFGALHLIFNMSWMWSLGRFLEVRFGNGRYLALILFTAIFSNTVQYLASGPGFGGMSGVVYGLFGFVMIRQWLHPNPEFSLPSNTIVFGLLWLVAGFTGGIGPIANGAHLGGLLAGGAVGLGNALMGGAWGAWKRRSEFRRSSAAARETALHQCSVCGVTEKSDPNREFRVAQNGEEYCDRHLPG